MTSDIASELIMVDRDKPFKLPVEFTDKFGGFSIKFQNKKAKQVLEFTLDDVIFMDVPKEYPMKASHFCNNLVGWGHTPLDAYCARAIFENKLFLEGLKSLWKNPKGKAVYSPNYLSSVSFLGTHFSKERVDHFLCLKYDLENPQAKPALVVYEDAPRWKRHLDYALVFKKEFIERCLNG